MKFINKNAYIQTAIYGVSFCKGARLAFFLILRNILRVISVNMVGDFVLLLGKVSQIFHPLIDTIFIAHYLLLCVVFHRGDYCVCFVFIDRIWHQWGNNWPDFPTSVHCRHLLFHRFHVHRDIRYGHHHDALLFHRR